MANRGLSESIGSHDAILAFTAILRIDVRCLRVLMNSSRVVVMTSMSPTRHHEDLVGVADRGRAPPTRHLTSRETLLPSLGVTACGQVPARGRYRFRRYEGGHQH
jgi:hypothetical protein